MSCDSQTNPPKAKILGWPLLAKLSVLRAGCWVLLLPAIYLVFLAITAWALWRGGLHAFEFWSVEPGWGLKNMGLTAVLLLGWGTWVGFFRPFWLRRQKDCTVLEMKAAAQPEWMETVAMAVAQARAPMPVEVCLTAGHEVRLVPADGVAGRIWGRHRLVVGAGWIAVCKEGQLIADLVSCLAQAPKGLAGRVYFVVQGMVQWLERVADKDQTESLAIENRLSFKGYQKRKAGMLDRPWIQRLIRGYDWLTRRPIWAMLILARGVTQPARRRVLRACDTASAQLLGGAAFMEVLDIKERTIAAAARIRSKVEAGIESHRLPDNLVLQFVKDMDQEKATPLPVDKNREAREKHLQKAATAGLISAGGAAALLVRHFQDICRQLTQMHYQQDLGLMLNQIRLVAVGEAAKTEGDATVRKDIEFYFQGLAHPRRPLLGLSTAGKPETEAEMMRWIEDGKQSMRLRGDQLRSMRREWEMAWQRCRDLEMAHAFALAGMPLDHRQYGLTAHKASLYRQEIAQQKLIMEQSDESMRTIEADLERRMLAALYLLLGRADEECAPEVLAMKRELPYWGRVYGSLCAKLPVLWEMTTLVFAFEALGLDDSVDERAFKHAEAGTEMEALGQAVDYLGPQIRDCLSRLLTGLETVPLPMKPEVSLSQWLLDGASFYGWETREAAVKSCHAAVMVCNRSMSANETVFAWLCRGGVAGEALCAVPVEPTPACESPGLQYFSECSQQSKSEPALAASA